MRVRVIVDNLRSLRHDVDTAQSDYDTAYDNENDGLINKALVTIADNYRKVMVAIQELDAAVIVAGVAEKSNPLEALTIECISLAVEVKNKREEIKAEDKAAVKLWKDKADAKYARSKSRPRSASPAPSGPSKKARGEGVDLV